MSVDSDVNVMEVCSSILNEQMENDWMPFSILVSDLLPVIMNYGTVKQKMWPLDHSITLPSAFRGKKKNLNQLDPQVTFERPFPSENLRFVLNSLLFNLKECPAFSEEERESMFYMMLNLAMARGISHDWSFIKIIKDILASIIVTYTDQEWSANTYRKVRINILVIMTSTYDHLLHCSNQLNSSSNEIEFNYYSISCANCVEFYLVGSVASNVVMIPTITSL